MYVLMMGALPFGVYIRAPGFWKLPHMYVFVFTCVYIYTECVYMSGIHECVDECVQHYSSWSRAAAEAQARPEDVESVETGEPRSPASSRLARCFLRRVGAGQPWTYVCLHVCMSIVYVCNECVHVCILAWKGPKNASCDCSSVYTVYYYNYWHVGPQCATGSAPGVQTLSPNLRVLRSILQPPMFPLCKASLFFH